MKKVISLLLVAVMLFAFGAPVVKAHQVQAERKVVLPMTIEEAFEIIDSAMEKFACKCEFKLYQKIRDLLLQIKEKLYASLNRPEKQRVGAYAEQPNDAVRYNPDTIYDLDSIPARIMLLGKLGLAMRFATTELVNKVDAAHAKVAGYVFGGLVYIANPFNRIEDLEEYGERLDALKAECLAMPDMGPDDTANLYKRAALDELLTKARFMKFNELKDKDAEVIKALEKAINKATLVRIKPQTTVAELDAAEFELLEAIEAAKRAEGKRADKKLVKQLRKLVWEARGRIIKAGFSGEDVAELKEVHDNASKEILKIRPSEDAVNDYIFALNALLH